MKLCLIENCNKKHYGKNYCQIHYQQIYRKGNITNTTIRNYNNIEKCTINNCTNDHHAKSFCSTHYTQFRKENGLYKQNNKLLEDIEFEYKDRNNWSLSVKMIFSDKCMLCGWDKAPCDVHHIIPHKDGGKNCIKNAIVLCPNDHKLADIKTLDRNYLQEISDKKLIEVFGEK
jgi:hypothetical protein